MSVVTHDGCIPVKVDAAYPQFTLLAWSSGSIADDTLTATAMVAATNMRLLLGYLTQESFASGDKRTVKLLRHGETFTAIAAQAIAAGGVIESAASGKIDPAAGTGVQLGTALEAAGANNERIECLFRPVIA